MPTTGIDRCEPSRSAAGASKGVNCRTRALASTPIRKRQRRRRQGRPSTPVVRLRLGTSTKQSSKAGSPEAASRAKATCDSLVPVSPKLTRREATMATKGWRTNNFTLRGGQMWRKHSCLPRRHSCRRSLPRARRSVELRPRRGTQKCVRHDSRCEVILALPLTDNISRLKRQAFAFSEGDRFRCGERAGQRLWWRAIRRDAAYVKLVPGEADSVLGPGTMELRYSAYPSVTQLTGRPGLPPKSLLRPGSRWRIGEPRRSPVSWTEKIRRAS